MKKLLTLVAILAGLIALPACSTINSRIAEKSAVYQSLDTATRAKIAQGDVGLGFTPDMVYMALGQPDARRQAITSTGQTETWIYQSYFDDYQPAFGGYHRFHRWFAMDPYSRMYHMYASPYAGPELVNDDIRVTFQNGRVVMIDQATS